VHSACPASSRLKQAPQRVHSVASARMKEAWDLRAANHAQRVPFRRLAVSQKHPASVPLGTKGKMEVSVHSAYLASTNKDSARLIALIVHQTLSLQAAVSQSITVNVMLGTGQQMEVHARSAQQANTIQVDL